MSSGKLVTQECWEYVQRYLDSCIADATDSVKIGGKWYGTCRIGDNSYSSTWLTTNLDLLIEGITYGLSSSSSIAYAGYRDLDSETYGWNGKKFGLMYNKVSVALLEQYKEQLFPGWHVPTATEFSELITFINGLYNSATEVSANVRSISDWDLTSVALGKDSFRLNFKPCGYYLNNVLIGADDTCMLQTTTSSAALKLTGSVFEQAILDNEALCPIRLIKDS